MRRADNLATSCAECLQILGASTSCNLKACFKHQTLCVISGFRSDVDKIWARLGYYAKVQEFLNSLALEDRMIGCPETSVRNCHSALRNIPGQRRV